MGTEFKSSIYINTQEFYESYWLNVDIIERNSTWCTVHGGVYSTWWSFLKKMDWNFVGFDCMPFSMNQNCALLKNLEFPVDPVANYGLRKGCYHQQSWPQSFPGGIVAGR